MQFQAEYLQGRDLHFLTKKCTNFPHTNTLQFLLYNICDMFYYFTITSELFLIA